MITDPVSYRSPEYITEAEATFGSSGGQLSALDSDVVITVGSGAVQEGTKQRFFFRVPKDDSTLLQDIPDMPEGTLISPVIECGPHGVTLLKPVEITVPHDLCLDEVRKDSIRVYRCEPSSDGKCESICKSTFISRTYGKGTGAPCSPKPIGAVNLG